MKFIIYNPSTQLFTFFINSLILELNRLKIYDEIIYYDDRSNKINNLNDVILIIINPHFIFDNKYISITIDKISKKYKYKILYLTEPVNFIIERKVYGELIKRIKPYCLWTYTSENFNKINTYLKIFKIFPSYNEAINITNFDYSIIKNKSINNIIFFGNINENRINIVNEFNKSNNSDHIKIINYTDKWSIDEWANILNNNLFYLNIHRRKGCKSLETFRINPILANGCIIFSERCNKEEEEYYKNYNIIFIEKDNLCNYIVNYINNLNNNNLNDNIYNDILDKSNKYRINMLHNNFDLNNYLDFHKLL
jgi:hypothetical protein